MSPLARRTSARPAGSGGGRGVAGHNVGTFLQRARSGRGCSARASAGDRAVAAQAGLASLCRPSSRARDTLIWPDLSTVFRIPPCTTIVDIGRARLRARRTEQGAALLLRCSRIPRARCSNSGPRSERRARTSSPCVHEFRKPSARYRAHVLRRARRSQGISGDLPIVLLRIADTENLDIVRELLQAH